MPISLLVSSTALNGVLATTVMPTARTPTVDAGYATFGSSDWSVTDEPSLSGDTIQLDFTALPTQANHVAEYFQAEIDGTVYDVPLGPLISDSDRTRIRRMRATQTAAQNVRMRVVWRHDTTDVMTAGGWTATKSVTTTSISADTELTLDITLSRTSGVCPAGLFMKAELSGTGALRPFFDVHYKWTFDETGNWDKLPSDFEHTRERSVDFGPMTAFTYETSGLKTITCLATWIDPDGNIHTKTNTASFTADDPDTFFGGAGETITVGATSQGDDYDAASVNTAISAINSVAVNSAVKRRLSLRKGFSYGTLSPIENTFHVPTSQARDVQHLLITSHGTGADPIVAHLDIREFDSSCTVTIDGIDAQGINDVTDPSNTDYSGDPGFELRAMDAATTIHNCKSTGNYNGISHDRGDIVITNTEIRDWRNFGMRGSGIDGPGKSRYLVGCVLKQSSDAVRTKETLDDGNGAGQKFAETPPMFGIHGPFRVDDDGEDVVFSKCDIFSNSTWSGGNVSTQNPIRWNAKGRPGFRAYINQCRIEGGALGFAVVTTAGLSAYTRNCIAEVLIERNRIIQTVNGSVFFPYAQSTMRNNIAVFPDTPPEGNPEEAIVTMGSSGAPPDGRDSMVNPVEVYSNTFVDLKSEANAINRQGTTISSSDIDDTSDTIDFSGVVTKTNNIFHAPNRTGGNQDITDSPLSTTAGATPAYNGRRVYDEVSFSYTGGAVLRDGWTLTGGTSGAVATVSLYSASGSSTGYAIMSNSTDFSSGETVTISNGGSGTFTISSIGTRHAKLTGFANTSAVNATFTPLTGSSAIGGASGKVAIDDYYGNIRKTTLAGLTRSVESVGKDEPNLES